MPAPLILLLDASFIALAVELTAWILGAFLFPGSDVGFRGVTVSATAGLLGGIATSYLTGLHQSSLVLHRKEVALRSLFVGAATALGVLLASHFVWYQALGRTMLLMVAATSALSVFAWRLVYGRYLQRGPRVRVAVLGDGPAEHALLAQLQGDKHPQYEMTGLLGRSQDPALSALGSIDDAVGACQREHVDIITVVGSSSMGPEHHEALAQLRVHGFELRTAEALFMALERRVPVDMVDERWLLGLFEQLDQTRDRVKRMVDICVSLLGLAFFGLLFPGLYLLVRLDSPGPFFYTQERVGLGNRVFRIFKVRTMKVAPPGADEQWAQSADARMTRLGRFLRRSRIDEMPQFWNVLRGDMSIVGPRPEQPKLAAELEASINFFSYRHLVKPGITGWAQINHGYAASVDESRTKLSYDLYYVRHHTLALDLDIMLRTFFVMLARIGSR
jgi:exopolysaccharide biosynthesis polyprenyl glycosylphosphotransferase